MIVVTTIRAAQEAKRATSTIPIVMTSLIDPVGQSLIASLARPGGNITGLANLADDVMPKLVEILHAVLPRANVFAILFNPANPANRRVVENTALQAKSIGVKLSPVEFKGRDQLPEYFLRCLCGNLPTRSSSCRTRRSMICALTFRSCYFSTDCRHCICSGSHRRRCASGLRTTARPDVSTRSRLRKENIGRCQTI